MSASAHPCAICLKTEMHDYRADHEYRPVTPGEYGPLYNVHAGEPIRLTTCLRCGATVTISWQLDGRAVHDAWHTRLAGMV